MYANSREAVPARQSLNEMGHRQPRIPMPTANTAAHSVVTNNVQTMCRQSAKKQWTCVSIGYRAEKHKNNSDIIGDQAAKIGLIIGPSISQHPIT